MGVETNGFGIGIDAVPYPLGATSMKRPEFLGDGPLIFGVAAPNMYEGGGCATLAMPPSLKKLRSRGANGGGPSITDIAA